MRIRKPKRAFYIVHTTGHHERDNLLWPLKTVVQRRYFDRLPPSEEKDAKMALIARKSRELVDTYYKTQLDLMKKAHEAGFHVKWIWHPEDYEEEIRDGKKPTSIFTEEAEKHNIDLEVSSGEVFDEGGPAKEYFLVGHLLDECVSKQARILAGKGKHVFIITGTASFPTSPGPMEPHLRDVLEEHKDNVELITPDEFRKLLPLLQKTRTKKALEQIRAEE